MELSENSYSDWYLPSKDELNKMYQYQKQIGGFQAGAYWSSSEINTTKSWFQNFSNGYQAAQIKTASYALRAVRSF